MAVKYVDDFHFPADFGFHKNGSASVAGKVTGHYKKGGHVKASTPQPYKMGGMAKKTPGNDSSKGMGAGKEHLKGGAPGVNADHKFPGTRTEKSSGVQKPAFKKGGSTTPYCYKDGGKVAHGKQWDGEKKPWSPDDAVSPGSANRPAPKQGMKNQAAARDKFATDGENTEPATKQTGEVQRMTGFSDFKRGGKIHKKAKGGHASTPQPYAKGGRIANLGHYAHGGKVDGAKYEKAAGTPKKSHDGSKTEHGSGKATGKSTAKAQGEKRENTKQREPKATRTEKSGRTMSPHHGAEPHMASGGLGRATGVKKNAAIHAKMHHQGPSLGALASALGGAGPMGAAHQPPGPGMGPAPPGLPPGMGAPPGGQAMGPPAGPMGPGGMSHGGGVKHVIVHHVSHRA